MIGEVGKLFERQLRAWPQLAKGVEGLARARTRRVRIDWFEVLLRHIPHRTASTTAPVDRESVARRPCFLCAQNLPREEEGIRYGDEYLIYCNPFPIVERHLTIAHRSHCAQRIAGRFGVMLDLAADLPGLFLIYNGPDCGASAPDHMHFQAGLRGALPIERETAGISGITVPNYRRTVILIRGHDRSELCGRAERIIELLSAVTGKHDEPMLNIAMYYEQSGWVVYLFPRGKHRPDVFHSGLLIVSPASIDLCGIFVVPREQDFDKITGDDVAAIFREVTLPDDQVAEVVRKLERSH